MGLKLTPVLVRHLRGQHYRHYEQIALNQAVLAIGKRNNYETLNKRPFHIILYTVYLAWLQPSKI